MLAPSAAIASSAWPAPAASADGSLTRVLARMPAAAAVAAPDGSDVEPPDQMADGCAGRMRSPSNALRTGRAIRRPARACDRAAARILAARILVARARASAA